MGEHETNGKTYFAEPIVGLSNFNILFQGAEAVSTLRLLLATQTATRKLPTQAVRSIFALLQRLYEGTFLGKPVIIKQRFSKKYRHSVLDSKLTQARFKQVRAMLESNA